MPAGVFADAIAIVDFSPPAPPPPHNSTEIPAPHHLLDVNGDGRADLVWYDATTSQAALWFLNGPTLLGGGLVGFPVDSAWQVVGVGDVNGDGKADLVWRHTTTGQVALWLLNGSELLGAGLVGAPLSLDWQLR